MRTRSGVYGLYPLPGNWQRKQSLRCWSATRVPCSGPLTCVRVVFQAELSNKRHRPIGVGVQGLADAFILMRYPFESPEAQLLNQQIFETIYYGALEASCELAKEQGPYETYAGCPVSRGVSGVGSRVQSVGARRVEPP